MKKIALCLAVTALVAACSGGEEPARQPVVQPDQAAQNAAAAPAAPAPGRPVAAPEGRRGADLLAAAGVDLDFPHEVLYDVLDKSASGTPRHRVLLEIKRGSTFDEAVAELDRTLQALGYEKTSDKKTGGRIDQVRVAEGKPTYYLIMQPAGMGPELHDKDSVGSIHIMWNIPHGGA